MTEIFAQPFTVTEIVVMAFVVGAMIACAWRVG